MKVPRGYRKQLLAYEREGFHVRFVESSKGSHIRAVFEEFSEPQWLTLHVDEDFRSIKNNISRFRRLQREQHGR
jgi:hypothetical protein